MAGHDVGADAALHFDTGDEGGDDISPAATLPLGEGEERGHDGHGGVAAHADVDVIEIERVRGRAVDQRGERCGYALARGDQRRLAGAAVFERLFAENRRQRLVRARERHAQPVEQALLRQEDGARIERVVVDIAAAGGEGGRKAAPGGVDGLSGGGAGEHGCGGHGQTPQGRALPGQSRRIIRASGRACRATGLGRDGMAGTDSGSRLMRVNRKLGTRIMGRWS